MKRKDDFSNLYGSDNSFIDHLWDSWSQDPDSVDISWQNFFKGFTYALQSGGDVVSTSGGGLTFSEEDIRKEFNVFRIVQSYRSRGHLLSNTNPIKPRKDRDAHISLQKYDLTEEDLHKKFLVGEFIHKDSGATIKTTDKRATLKEILDFMQAVYCKKIGIEYMHINNTKVRRWVREKFEASSHFIDFPIEKKKRILEKLNGATGFENFLQTKYVGQKRFSLEGGETMIPGVDALINRHSELGGEEVCIGMAHRGRLNALANIVGKTYEFIFDEFEGLDVERVPGSGDVKYHMGYTSIVKSLCGRDVTIKLMPNPSHLEPVGPVVQGYCRAQLDLVYEGDGTKMLPIILHGDSAIAGQGIVYESVQMSKLPAYDVGGSIHFVINNQIGFTTEWHEARTSTYCTSVAKMIDAPVFHVNGDDADAVVYVCELAIDYRNAFQGDVFVDMVCYRKYGHNEGDEPKFTNPALYGFISKAENPRQMYINKLMQGDQSFKQLAEEMEKEFQQFLQDRFERKNEDSKPTANKGPHQEWKNLRFSKRDDWDASPITGVSKDKLDKIAKAVTTVPESVRPLKKAQRILNDRAKKYEADHIDWPMAEKLAYGSLLIEGKRIRFTGQDVVRGTFSHRHAKVFDEFTNEAYCGLDHIESNQANIEIYNSLLSEYAVLGYEYGYSLGSPNALCIWEAQFGDFANTAQVIIDQFIAAAEQKWQKMSGLVLLLPHGYEGQGPEHSSARVERFLTLAAQGSMVIANCTTPANFFHLLRRQVHWDFRKPLIHFSPKSLLRHPKVLSNTSDLTTGAFKETIDDTSADPSKIKRVLWCTGKVYYDLLDRKESEKIDHIAIVRLEQLYPMPKKQVNALLEKYNGAEQVWVQEEPKNMGAWGFLNRFKQFEIFKYVGRKSSSSPAVGHGSVHQREQKDIVDRSFSAEELKRFR